MVLFIDCNCSAFVAAFLLKCSVIAVFVMVIITTVVVVFLVGILVNKCKYNVLVYLQYMFIMN